MGIGRGINGHLGNLILGIKGQNQLAFRGAGSSFDTFAAAGIIDIACGGYAADAIICS